MIVAVIALGAAVAALGVLCGVLADRARESQRTAARAREERDSARQAEAQSAEGRRRAEADAARVAQRLHVVAWDEWCEFIPSERAWRDNFRRVLNTPEALLLVVVALDGLEEIARRHGEKAAAQVFRISAGRAERFAGQGTARLMTRLPGDRLGIIFGGSRRFSELATDLAEPIRGEWGTGRVVPTIAVVSLFGQGRDLRERVSVAGAAVDQAREAGPGQCYVWDDLRREVVPEGRAALRT